MFLERCPSCYYVLHSTTCLVRCVHVLSVILNNIFIYLFNRHISLGAFVSESETYNQPVKCCGHHFLPRQFFLKHVLILFRRIFPYCRKAATTLLISYRNIVNECCHNVVEMFSYKFVRQRYGNILETFLEYVAVT